MNKINFLKELFFEVVVKKDSEKQKDFYHPKFKLFANGIEQEYDSYIKEHEKIYKTEVQYKFDIDEDTCLESDDKAAMRAFVTLSYPKKESETKKIEVVLIAQFKDHKIFRIWETTSPDWSKMNNFKDYKTK